MSDSEPSPSPCPRSRGLLSMIYASDDSTLLPATIPGHVGMSADGGETLRHAAMHMCMYTLSAQPHTRLCVRQLSH